MNNKSNLLLFGSVIIIVLAIALISILGKTSPTGSSPDISARAGTKYTLKLLGVVQGTDEAKGTIQVTNVHFADANRAGEPQNLGDWTVTAPAAFNFTLVSPGTTVMIGVDASTFRVSTHAVTAITLSPGD